MVTCRQDQSNPANAQLKTGTIAHDKIKVDPQHYLGVNYRTPTYLSIERTPTHRPDDLRSLLRRGLIRTVFVANAEHVVEFLTWAGEELLKDAEIKRKK